MDTNLTIRESIKIAAPPNVVLDYTQDFAHRRDWDDPSEAAQVVATEPRRVRVRLKDTGTATIVYRLERRPELTRLAFEDIESPWIRGGGGSWTTKPCPPVPAGPRPIRSCCAIRSWRCCSAA